jgi:hypothetical protein
VFSNHLAPLPEVGAAGEEPPSRQASQEMKAYRASTPRRQPDMAFPVCGRSSSEAHR